MSLSIENKTSVELDLKIDVSPIDIDVSNEKNKNMRERLNSLLGKVSNLLEDKKDEFINEIAQHKDKLGFGIQVGICMRFTEVFIEDSSRNKTMCIAVLGGTLDKEALFPITK